MEKNQTYLSIFERGWHKFCRHVSGTDYLLGFTGKLGFSERDYWFKVSKKENQDVWTSKKFDGECGIVIATRPGLSWTPSLAEDENKTGFSLHNFDETCHLWKWSCLENLSWRHFSFSWHSWQDCTVCTNLDYESIFSKLFSMNRITKHNWRVWTWGRFVY